MKKKVFVSLLILFLCPQIAYSQESPLKLTLEECIKLSLMHNYKIKQMEKQIKSSKANVLVSHSALYPQIKISISSEYSRVGNNSPFSSTIKESYSSSISLNQLIYDSGKTKSSIQKAESQLLITQSEYTNTKIGLIHEVKLNYYDLLYKQKVLEVAKEVLNRAKLHLELASERFSAGLTIKSDVLKAEVEVKKAALELISAQNELKKSNMNLNRVMGIALQQEIFIDEEFEILPIEKPVEFYINLALKRRQEVLQQDLQIKDLKLSLKNILAERKPRFSFVGSYTQRGSEFPPKNGTWNIGIFGNLDSYLYDGGKIRNTINSYSADIERAKIKKIELVEEIKRQVINAYLDLKKAYEGLSVADEAVSYAEENLKLAEGRYAAGVGTIIELIDAQVTLKRAKLEKINYIISYLKAKAELEKAVAEENF